MAKSQDVQIKGTRNGLIIVLNPACEMEELKHALLYRLKNARDFFRGARFTFYHGKRGLPSEHKQELLRIVAEYGLIYEENITFPTGPKEAISCKKPAQNPPVEIDRSRKAQVQNGAAFPAEPPLPHGADPALLVRQSLRSGQSVVTAKHLVIAGDVHAGASVTAAGSILVLGTLSGIAHAGVHGDRSVVVFARKLAPAALSIAGIAATPQAKPLVDGKAMLRGNTVIYDVIRR
ncbi:MAG: septum site-determining protein MinC [Bacillota bacterium]